MKICPICEGKIDGRWCKSCFRFVTPWELPKGTHINERHSQVYDKNCEYHNPTIKYDKQEYMTPGYENKIYGNGKRTTQVRPQTQQRPQQQYTRTNTQNNQKKNNGGAKTVRVIIAVYVILMILGVLFSLVPIILEEVGGFEAIQEYVIEMFEDEEEDVEVDDKEEYDWYMDWEKEEESEESDHEFLSAIEPLYTEKTEYGEVYTYYDASDIQGLEYSCDDTHMDMNIDDFMDMMSKVFTGYDITIEGYVGEDSNYKVTSESGWEYVRFDTIYHAECEEFYIDISVDTATGDIHFYEFGSYNATEEFYKAVDLWFEAYLPDAVTTEDSMSAYLKQLGENTGYEVTESDEYEISCFVMDEYVSVSVFPTY